MRSCFQAIVLAVAHYRNCRSCARTLLVGGQAYLHNAQVLEDKKLLGSYMGRGGLPPSRSWHRPVRHHHLPCGACASHRAVTATLTRALTAAATAAKPPSPAATTTNPPPACARRIHTRRPRERFTSASGSMELSVSRCLRRLKSTVTTFHRATLGGIKW